MLNKDLMYFKKRKNGLLFVLSFSFLLLILAILAILIFDLVGNDLIMTLYFLFLIAYLIVFVYLRSKIVFYSMNYSYHKMVDDDLGTLRPDRKLYTQSWLNMIINDGYVKFYENNDYTLYYQFFKKLKNIGRTGYVLIAVVVSKRDSYDFYENNLNMQIERLYNNYAHQQRVKKQIIIQFKKYEQYTAAHKDSLQEIINYKNGEQVVINIPVGYFVETNEVYFLRPKKIYFNKFHFYTTQLIEILSYIKGDEESEQ